MVGGRDDARGSDNDILLGGFGNDTLIGGAGDDIVEGDNGVDRLIGGEGAEEDVDRLALAPADIRLGDPETPPLDAEDGVGGQDIDMVRLDQPVIGCDMDSHIGVLGKHLVQAALALRAEVGDDDDGQAGAGLQAAEETLQRLDPAG